MKVVSVFLLMILLVGTALPHGQAQSEEPTMNPTDEATLNGTETVPTLRSLAERRGFYMGTAVAYPPLTTEAAYRDVLSREYNIVVPENAMKWDDTEPTQGVFTFTQGDKIVDFAEANGMQIRGHNLVWHNQIPGWVSGATDRDTLLKMMRDHINGLAGHYKGKILAWDVVNEAVGDNGSLRNDVWLNVIGPDYIEQAFRFAHQADPAAQLFYNDYNGEGLGRKSDAIYNLVKDLKAKGVPIDGVGLQMHIGIGPRQSPSPKDVAANMDRLAALGLKVQITEMDIKIQDGTGTDAQKFAAQAALYGDMLRVCLAHPACTAFLTWGFTDQYTWIPAFTHKDDAPLPFDKTYQPKPAYATLLNLLAQP